MTVTVRNHILCPDCYAVESGEQKCCCHAVYAGIVCVRCGAKKAPVDMRNWVCKGNLFESEDER